jgi:hypothetical protein|tara:strand:- start:413 stop:751 length:339 start_codon:yes stop_codon:yes gene_type:complete
MPNKSGWWKFHDDVREITKVQRDSRLSNIIKYIIQKLETVDRETVTVNSSWYATNLRSIENMISDLDDLHYDAYSKQFATNALEYFNKTNDQSIKNDSFVLQQIEVYKKRVA